MVGTVVEESLRDSIHAFLKRDEKLAHGIIEKDTEIDQMEVEVEEECLKILALHQPVAIDLRYIVSVLKINNDLERIGDLASNIAERVCYLGNKPYIYIPDTIPKMAKTVQEMLKLSLDALVKSDIDLAEKAFLADDYVDKLHSDMFPFVQEKIETEPEKIPEWLQLLSISRYLERAADHCTNIAEDVIYMVEGKIVRHSQMNENEQQ